MEYKIFKFMRHHVRIPFFIRFIFGMIFILVSAIPIILPIFPGSLFVWVLFLVIWILLIVPWKKIRHVIKIRKWIIYLLQNFRRKRILKHKVKDIKEHIKDILNEK